MARPQTPIFSDDAPKENPWQDDRLGFRPFTQRLAEMILELDATNGYVIGLHSSWGGGKTTALNFVKAFISKYNQEVEAADQLLNVIDFQPWMVSGHQDLVASFFKVLSEALDEGKVSFLQRCKSALRVLAGSSIP